MKLFCFFTGSFYLARLKKSLSETSIFIATKRIDQVSKSANWNEHHPLHVIFSIDTATKLALLEVKATFSRCCNDGSICVTTSNGQGIDSPICKSTTCFAVNSSDVHFHKPHTRSALTYKWMKNIKFSSTIPSSKLDSLGDYFR
jgi:hypothetical protein